MHRLFQGLAVLAAGFGLVSVAAAEEVLNLYSSRHYQTDEALYENFTKETGIKINRIEAKGDALIERIKSEGANSPADVLLTVDAGRLWRADEAGLFQPVSSDVLQAKVPDNLRHPAGHWYGFSTRARVIYYAKDRGQARRHRQLRGARRSQVEGQDLHPLQLEHLQPSIPDELCDRGARRAGRGRLGQGRPGQLRARPTGRRHGSDLRRRGGRIRPRVGNTYYYVRLLTSSKDKDKAVADKVGVIFPNQGDRGTHVNISGAGVMKNAPNKDAAVEFLEYLASEGAQRYFADGNNEYPVVAGVDANSAVGSSASSRSTGSTSPSTARTSRPPRRSSTASAGSSRCTTLKTNRDPEM